MAQKPSSHTILPQIKANSLYSMGRQEKRGLDSANQARADLFLALALGSVGPMGQLLRISLLSQAGSDISWGNRRASESQINKLV